MSNLTIMIDCMMHEPFYTSGTYVNERLGLYVGWVCHDSTFSDCMPIFNEKKDIVLFFTGEDFTDEDVKARLKSRGHVFESSNASYLIHLYEEDEDQFAQRLNGWFSGMIVDLRKSKTLIFNDRFGMQRIYYHEGDNEYLFSSEAKSLLKIKPLLRNLSSDGLGEFINYGCVLGNKSIFSKIFIMPAGSSWTFYDCNITERGHYFEPNIWENQPTLEKEAFYSKVRETFQNILPRYCRSENPIGISVTGGLDTRLILAYIDSSQPYPCYTFGGIYRDCLDVQIGREVAAVCGQQHQVISINKEFFIEYPDLAEKTVYLTDGCHHVCGAQDVFLNRRARDIASIRVSGIFGGEVMRSVTNLKTGHSLRKLFQPDFYGNILKAHETAAEIRCGRSLSYSVFQGIPWRMYGVLRAEQSQITLHSPYMDNDFVKLMYQAPDDMLFKNEISLRLIEDNSPELAKITTDRGFGGRRADFMSRFYELYYFGLFKLDWYYGVGMPDWATKLEAKSGLSYLRKPFLGIQRIDHYRMWFKNELSDYVREVLLDRVSTERSYLAKNALECVVEDHISGRRNYTSEINKLLTIELIQRLLVENI